MRSKSASPVLQKEDTASKQSKTSGLAQSDSFCVTSSPPSSSTTCISTVTYEISFNQDECCECLHTCLQDVNQGTGMQ